MILPSNELVGLIWAQFWQLTVLIVVVGALTRTLCRHRPHLAHLLWILVLVKCLTPPIWSSRLGVFSWAQAPAIAAPAAATGKEEWMWFPMLRGEEQSVATEPPSDNVLAKSSSSPTGSVWRWTIGTLSIIWFSGAAGLALLTLLNWRVCLAGLRRSHVATDSRLEAIVRRVAGQLGLRRPVRLLVNSERLGPAVFGLFRPTLVLPRAVLDGKAPHQIEPIVAHELVHLRRGDVLLGMLQGTAQLVWWFHPLVWWSNRQASQLCERCCDEEVVASLRYSPRDYARCLLDVLEQKHTLRSFFAFPGIRPVEVTSRRLENIMKHANHFHARMPRAYWLVLLAAGVLVLPGAAFAPHELAEENDGAGQSQADSAGGAVGGQNSDAENKVEAALKELGALIERNDEGHVIKVKSSWPQAQLANDDLVHLGKLSWSKTSPTLLSLRFAQITDAGLKHLKGLTHVRHLDLKNRQITDAGLVHLAELKNLEVLVLGGTKVTDAGLKTLKGLTGLKSLWLYSTDVTDAGLVHLKELKNLETLILDGTKVTGDGLKELTNLGLEILQLGDSDNITDAGLAHLKELNNLHGLRIMGDTKISDAGLVHLKGLNLQWLDLRRSEIGDEGLAHLKELNSLFWLALTETKVSDAGLVHLKDFANLKTILLNDTDITDAGLEHLKELKNLEQLNLQGTDITDEAIEQLQEALPDCKIGPTGEEQR